METKIAQSSNMNGIIVFRQKWLSFHKLLECYFKPMTFWMSMNGKQMLESDEEAKPFKRSIRESTMLMSFIDAIQISFPIQIKTESNRINGTQNSVRL